MVVEVAIFEGHLVDTGGAFRHGPDRFSDLSTALGTHVLREGSRFAHDGYSRDTAGH
jgi:hypothetical protein